MGDLRTRLSAAPLPVLFVAMAAMFGGAMYFLPRSEGEALTVGGAVVSGLLWASLMTIGIVVMRRRDARAGGDQVVSERLALERSLKSGEPPVDQHLDEALIALIARRRDQLRFSARVAPWLFGVFAVMSALVAITGSPTQWAYVLVFVGFVVWTRWSVRRSLDRYDRLEAALRLRAPASQG